MSTRKQPIKTIAELIKFLGQTYPLDGAIDVQTLEDGDGPLTFSATLCEPKPEPETTAGYNTNDFINIIADPASWPNFMRLFNNASVIVGDFDQWGEVLQESEGGNGYDADSSIEQLRGAIHLISPGSINEGDYLPWLSTEQQQRLEEVAAEVIAWGDGQNIRDISYGKAEAETMTPRERLDQLKDDNDWRCKRLGFNPETGEVFKD
jgi:hypothetical protein